MNKEYFKIEKNTWIKPKGIEKDGIWYKINMPAIGQRKTISRWILNNDKKLKGLLLEIDLEDVNKNVSCMVHPVSNVHKISSLEREIMRASEIRG